MPLAYPPHLTTAERFQGRGLLLDPDPRRRDRRYGPVGVGQRASCSPEQLDHGSAVHHLLHLDLGGPPEHRPEVLPVGGEVLPAADQRDDFAIPPDQDSSQAQTSWPNPENPYQGRTKLL